MSYPTGCPLNLVSCMTREWPWRSMTPRGGETPPAEDVDLAAAGVQLDAGKEPRGMQVGTATRRRPINNGV